MARAPHPAKEKSIQWVIAQHERKPFDSAKAAAQAILQQFDKEGMAESTVLNWVRDSIDEFRPKPRGGGKLLRKPAGPPVFTFEDAKRQMEYLRNQMIRGLIADARSLEQAREELAGLESRLNASIDEAARITGMPADEITARVNAALNPQ